MLRHESEINGYTVGASDGQLGTVCDFLFDDASWQVRWLVVDTGNWLSDRKVLLPPSVLSSVNHIAHQFAVRLTMQQVKDSPDIDTDRSVSRQMESNVYDYYGASPYWNNGLYMGSYTYMGGGFFGGPGYLGGLGAASRPPHRDDRIADTRRSDGDPRLRSVKEVTGYHIHANDGEIGHVEDFLVEDADWSIQYLVVDTKNWWPGKKVLISPRSATDINWTKKTVKLDVDRQRIKDSPPYDPSTPVDPTLTGMSDRALVPNRAVAASPTSRRNAAP